MKLQKRALLKVPRGSRGKSGKYAVLDEAELGFVIDLGQAIRKGYAVTKMSPLGIGSRYVVIAEEILCTVIGSQNPHPIGKISDQAFHNLTPFTA